MGILLTFLANTNQQLQSMPTRDVKSCTIWSRRSPFKKVEFSQHVACFSSYYPFINIHIKGLFVVLFVHTTKRTPYTASMNGKVKISFFDVVKINTFLIL